VRALRAYGSRRSTAQRSRLFPHSDKGDRDLMEREHDSSVRSRLKIVFRAQTVFDACRSFGMGYC
jgi:hypothetical protein